MSAQTLLDLHGVCRMPGGTDASIRSLQDALKTSADTTVCLVTDWGAGGVFGVATVLGPAGTAAAVLEKQLRDQGETDDIAHILVHQSQARMGSTELAYTAVPIKAWRRYQQAALEHSQLVLLYDWVRTLAHWARIQKIATGTLLVMSPDALDLLVLEQGRIRVLDRLRIFNDEVGAWERLGHRVTSILRELDISDSESAASSPGGVTLLVTPGVESHLPHLVAGLAPTTVGQVWAETPELARTRLNDPSMPVKTLSWTDLADSLPLRQAVNRSTDKAAAWADRWVLPIGMAAFALSFIMAITAGFMHYQTQLGLASISGDTRKAQTTWQTLHANVQTADQLAGQQKSIRDWIQLRMASRKVPDMSSVLSHIRGALPPDMVIDEVGLVVDKGAHLVTIIGHAGVIEDSLRSESVFAQALQADGFTLQKRDLLLRDGQPKFKLSMTWSAS